jgi:hypothetical protein
MKSQSKMHTFPATWVYHKPEESLRITDPGALDSFDAIALWLLLGFLPNGSYWWTAIQDPKTERTLGVRFKIFPELPAEIRDSLRDRADVVYAEAGTENLILDFKFPRQDVIHHEDGHTVADWPSRSPVVLQQEKGT